MCAENAIGKVRLSRYAVPLCVCLRSTALGWASECLGLQLRTQGGDLGLSLREGSGNRLGTDGSCLPAWGEGLLSYWGSDSSFFSREGGFVQGYGRRKALLRKERGREEARRHGSAEGKEGLEASSWLAGKRSDPELAHVPLRGSWGQ